MIDLAAAGAAMAMGALGSAHCAAMCGPLAVAGCSKASGVSATSTAGYFGGRAIAYATMGAIAGHLGKHALCILPTRAIELTAAFAVAATMIGRGISLARRPKQRLVTLGTGRSRQGGVASFFAELLPRRGLALGLATGILPCGLLMSAWLLAGASATATNGALVMLAFSMATLPGLVLPVAARRAMGAMASKVPRRALAVLWCLLGLWVLARPLLVAAHCHS